MEPNIPNIPNANADWKGQEPLLAQANLARLRGQWNEAVDSCVRVLRVDPGNADAHSLLGDIYRDQNAIDDAIQWYRMASDLRPNGADTEKLRKLEAERERRAAQSGPLTSSLGAGVYEGAPGGTTQLMGYSPKRWLNTLTIVSACFLAATIIVLAMLRMNSPAHSSSLPQPMQLSSHPIMPTAETGISLPPVNPNRPSVLPAGEQPRTPSRVHQTGDGLEPDRTNSSRTLRLPTFAARTPAGAPASSQTASPSHELPPANVQFVQPIDSSLNVATDESRLEQAQQPSTQSRSSANGMAGQSEAPASADARESAGATSTTKPASEDNAGESHTGGGGIPPGP